ncbi:MAG: arylesterase [Burkholderiales bacterium]
MKNNSLKANSYKIFCGVLLVFYCAMLGACGGKTAALPRLATDDVVLAFGDSLTFGTGASEGESYPAVLATIIKRKIIRAGVPGETTAEGLRRLPDALDEHQPKLLILCSGGNDFLRKMSEQQAENNLREMIRLVRARGIAVVLLGVPKPALFGGGSADLYRKLAQEFSLPLEENIFAHVLRKNELKADPIHPNAKGYRAVAEAVAALLKKAGAV